MHLCAALWLQDCSYPWTCGEHGTSFECGCNCEVSWVPDMNAHYSPFQYCNVYMYDQDDSGAAVYFAQNQVPPGMSPASHPDLLQPAARALAVGSTQHVPYSLSHVCKPLTGAAMCTSSPV